MAKPDLIKWVTDDSASKMTDPGSTKKLAGWIYTERPPFQYFNWLFNRIHKWFLGLQGGYFDIVVGSATQVTNLEATHAIANLNDTLVVAGSKVLILDGTHTLAANLALSNTDVTIIGESRQAIVDVATFQILLSGARTLFKSKVTNAGANDIQLSAADSKFIGLNVAETAVQATNGAEAEFLDSSTEGISDRFTKQKGFIENTLTDATNIAWDLDGNQVAQVTLAGNRTLSNPTNMKAGNTYVLTVKQDATGSRTLAFGSNYKWPSGVAPTLSTAANAVDKFSFISDGTNMFGDYGFDYK